MKKSALLLFALITVFMFSGCEIYGLVKDLTDKEEGRITTTDGKVLTGRIMMPNVNTKKISIMTVDSQKIEVEAKDIQELLVWKKTHTDIKHVLHYLPSYQIGKAKKMRDPMWMALIASGPYLNIYACSYDYSIPSDGDLKITSVKGGSIEYYALKEGETIATGVNMSDYSKRSARKNLEEYLSDDPVLCKKLEEQEIKVRDYETIANEYNPKR
jgi:hypothetical protein